MAFSPRELSPTTATVDVACSRSCSGSGSSSSSSSCKSLGCEPANEPEITADEQHRAEDAQAASSKPLHARPGSCTASGALKQVMSQARSAVTVVCSLCHAGFVDIGSDNLNDELTWCTCPAGQKMADEAAASVAAYAATNALRENTSKSL